MTFADIKVAFEGLIDDTSPDNALLTQWINEALGEISAEYGVEDTLSLSTNGGVFEDLPEDFLRIQEVRQGGPNGGLVTGYEVTESGQIMLDSPGTYHVRFHRFPAPMSGVDSSESPEVHQLLHATIPYYMAGIFYDRESMGDREESDMGSKFYQKFEYLLKKRVLTLRGRRSAVYGFR